MTQTEMWLTIVLMGVISYGLRVSFIALSGRFDLPILVRRGLAYAPAAVLFALILPAVLVRNQALALSLANERIVASLLAAVVAWWTRNIVATIVVGMVTMWLLQSWL